MTVFYLWGPPHYLFRGPPLLCFGAALQHQFTFKKASFLMFIKPNYLLQNVKRLWWADKSCRSARVVAWDGKLPPCPHTARAVCLTVDQDKGTEDEVSLAHMFPVGITKRTCDQWKILTMTLWQLPCPPTVPLHGHFSGFLLCTLYPCSSSTGSVSSCLYIACCLNPFMGYCHRLFTFPCIQEVIRRCLFLQRLSDFYCPSNCC